MMNKKTAKPAAEKPEEKKPEQPKTESKKAAKEVTVKVGGTEYTGLCISKRKTNSGAQVFLKIKGKVPRWFNAEDIVK